MQAQVALRKESVDRNTSIDNLTQGVFESLSARRAWIEIYLRRTPQQAELSLSARRAWIEIANMREVEGQGEVALRKESVDRNHIVCIDLIADKASLSARRAWIEITSDAVWVRVYVCRSPQGERG